MSPYLIRFIPLLFIIVLWSVLTYGKIVDPVFLPTPIETLTAFKKLLTVEFLRANLLPSVERVTGGFVLSVLVAFPLGVLSSQLSIIRHLVHPICAFVRYLPVAAFVPLCILWFGIDDEQKIAVIMLGVVFPLVLLIAADTASVPNELIETGRTFGLTWFQIVKRIVLPWSFPAIWDDLRISAGWAWSYLVLAELVAGNRGSGTSSFNLNDTLKPLRSSLASY